MIRSGNGMIPKPYPRAPRVEFALYIIWNLFKRHSAFMFCIQKKDLMTVHKVFDD